MPPDRALEIEGITKHFGTVTAVDGLSMEVRAGELFGFVGRNGAGKTTTMRVVLGVLAPDAGRVMWDGVPLDFAARRRIGYMPEERGLYPRMRCLEQLAYLGELHGMADRDARAAGLRWLERFGLAEGRDTELQALSLGNQQRVQLAAALVFDPDVLVLDEPLAGLDPVAVDVMSGVLRERADAGLPVIFSSHELDLVERLCDRTRSSPTCSATSTWPTRRAPSRSSPPCCPRLRRFSWRCAPRAATCPPGRSVSRWC